MAGNQRRRVEWESRLARWRKSGLTVRQFCLSEGVSEPSFFQWRKRLAGGITPPSNSEPVGAGVRPVARFLPLELIGSSPTDDRAVEIRLPTGVVLRVPAGVDDARLRLIVQLMRGEDS